MSDDLTTWLRGQVGADLSRWRGLEAAYLPNVEREGKVLYFEAQERVADCEAKLAILDEHSPVAGGDGTSGIVRPAMMCRVCSDRDDDEVERWLQFYPCRTVRILVSAYRRRPGYRDEWKP